EASAYWGAHGISKKAAEHMMQTWSLEMEQHPQLRFNAVIPGAIQSPQRKKSHPGEVHVDLPDAQHLIAMLVYLMGQESRNVRGQLFI
ncbi:MAG: NAD(P)-dependent oxidoreductase, partial [Nitrosomonadales bacterium]|nr:NAD(P)-dependent oxidoreductase [Nitrosomonadales bacterium]